MPHFKTYNLVETSVETAQPSTDQYPTTDASKQEWRSVALWDAQKPEVPEYIPGLPGVNRQLFEEYNLKYIAYVLCKTERLMHGIPVGTEREQLEKDFPYVKLYPR